MGDGPDRFPPAGSITAAQVHTTKINLTHCFVFFFSSRVHVASRRSGVYDDPACSPRTINHAMLLVGYTRDAWILKNWWSSKWGDNGYMYLARGRNQCAVSSYAAYATVSLPRSHHHRLHH